jgi:uncharacterized 2Fe-2S/4Fe-4S cluster protein (DUF4445 family)
MPMVRDLTVVVNKTKVMEAIQCYKNNPGYEEMLILYEEILPEFKLLVKPAAVYVFMENTAGASILEASDCSNLFCCALTLGQGICDKISECFAEGSYLKGNLMNALANELLLDYEQQLYENIKKEADLEGYGLTQKLMPGENGFDLVYQEEIIERIFKEAEIRLGLTADYLLQPAKSMIYVYGADSEQLTAEVHHDCLHCDNIGCSMREGVSGTVELTVVGKDGNIKTIQADKTKSILANLTQGGIYTVAPCNGKGTCGKCKIKLNEEICLACQSYPQEDCMIKLLGTQEENFTVSAEFVETKDAVLDSGFTVERLVLADAAWPTHSSLTEHINLTLHNTYGYSHKALKKLSALTETNENKAVSLIINNGTVIDICLAAKSRILGIAVDIGTTTIVISLIDMESGTTMDNFAALNSQRQYGADIITRIEYNMAGGDLKLKECVCRDILKGIDVLTKGVTEDIQHIVITGNTTMLYLLLGLSVNALAAYPFRTTVTDFLEFSFWEIFNSNLLDCRVTVMPGIAAYIGADILAGLLQCGFASADSISLLIDIGTNGEMVIGNKSRLLCLATAAGPAFEGAGISSGTGSVKGAISSFTIEKDKLCYETIQDAPAIGICGSGAIDIAAACLSSKWLDRNGQFNEEKVKDGWFKIAESVYDDIIFTQKDIRQLQLAKAAIRTGVETLMENYGCQYADIDTVYLAGGFGANINVESAAVIGLIPRELKYKVKTVGNSALGGAICYLLNHQLKETVNSLKAAAVYLDLAADNQFNNSFMRYMQF